MIERFSFNVDSKMLVMLEWVVENCHREKKW